MFLPVCLFKCWDCLDLYGHALAWSKKKKTKKKTVSVWFTLDFQMLLFLIFCYLEPASALELLNVECIRLLSCSHSPNEVLLLSNQN